MALVDSLFPPIKLKNSRIFPSGKKSDGNTSLMKMLAKPIALSDVPQKIVMCSLPPVSVPKRLTKRPRHSRLRRLGVGAPARPKYHRLGSGLLAPNIVDSQILTDMMVGIYESFIAQIYFQLQKSVLVCRDVTYVVLFFFLFFELNKVSWIFFSYL